MAEKLTNGSNAAKIAGTLVAACAAGLIGSGVLRVAAPPGQDLFADLKYDLRCLDGRLRHVEQQIAQMPPQRELLDRLKALESVQTQAIEDRSRMLELLQKIDNREHTAADN